MASVLLSLAACSHVSSQDLEDQAADPMIPFPSLVHIPPTADAQPKSASPLHGLTGGAHSK